MGARIELAQTYRDMGQPDRGRPLLEKAAEIAESDTGSANLPLGVVPDAAYDQRAFRAHSGDRLLLYTDGLTEAPNPDGRRFGEARLRAVLVTQRDQSS